MRTLVFLMVVMACNLCYGQVPITKDRVLILVTTKQAAGLSRDAERNFSDPGVLKYMGDKAIQFVHIYGEDTTPEWRQTNKITHYPAIVYYMKKDGEYTLSKTVSGPEISKALGIATQIRNLLGMKAETYKMPPQLSNNPLIPGPQSSPPVQYVAPPQQYVQPPQQFMNQWGSAPPSS